MWRFSVVPFSGATIALCLTSITHTYLLFHCFPYIGYMSVQLIGLDERFQNVTVDSVGWYAGLLGTAFTTGRCLSFGPWKRLRKHYSAKKSLLLSLLLSALCSIWFGMSRTFTSALVARFCLGLSNTLSGCVKRIAIIRDMKARENRPTGEAQPKELAPARLLEVMWWGSAIGPLMGGVLSNPTTYAQHTFLPEAVEDSYAYLLPNIVAAVLCFLSMVTVAIFISESGETTAASHHVHVTPIPPDENSPLLKGQRNSKRIDTVVSMESLAGKIEAAKTFWKNHNTRCHLLAYWAFSFVVVCIDEALPLFLIAEFAGPGLSPSQIGWILSIGGFIAVLSHSFDFKRILSRRQCLGFYHTLKVASLMGNVPSVLVPLILTLNGGTYFHLATLKASEGGIEPATGVKDGEVLLWGPPGRLTWGGFIFLALLTGCLRVFCSVYFAHIGVAIGRTVPHGYEDESARQMTLGALGARAIAPVIAGVLVYFFLHVTSESGEGAVELWLVIGLVFGLCAAALTFRLHEHAGHSQFDGLFHRLVRFVWQRRDPLSTVDENETDTIEERDGETEDTSSGKRASWRDHVLRPGLDPETVPFFILGTHKHDKKCLPHVLTPSLMAALHTYLPMNCSQENFWLKFSLVRNGSSLKALEANVYTSINTFMAIETLEGDVFGCFMTKPWQMTNRYELCGNSFLWRMRHPRRAPTNNPSEETLNEIAKNEGDVEVFRWTGESDDCQLFSARRLAAGGGIVDGKDGFGFILHDGLSSGTSSPCLAYGNPCLVSSRDGRFEIANMEVWAMTPFLFDTEALESENRISFIQSNRLNARDAPSSAQSAWTQFL